MLRTKPSLNLISRHLTLSSHNNLLPLHHYHHQNHHPTLTQNLLLLLQKCPPKKFPLQQIHVQMLINPIHQPNYLLSKIILLEDFTYASLFFSQIPNPNDFAFNIFIRALTTTWKCHSATIHFYYQMKFSGLIPNKFTFPFVFMSCASLLALDHGKTAHSMVFKVALDADAHVNHCLITMYARCGEVCHARKVFDEIQQRDLVSWNSMISGYSKMGFTKESVGLFVEMSDSGFEPDERTLVTVLVACGDLGDLDLGKRVERTVVEKKMKLNSYVGSSLISMYAKCGDLMLARRVFDAMEHKDVVIWNAMITGYAQNGASDEAITVFNYMRAAGKNPNKITVTAVLSACASIGALDLGEWLETYALQSGLQHDIFVASALIDMYAKCGSLENALRVFESMPHKNEVSWNSMISAFAFHGRAQEALSLFRRMLKDSGAARPDEVTFVGVLSACVHAGLVDEGRQLFNSMNTSFGLTPKIEHYSCMVDLLARAGHLHEAWDFVEKMPGKPDGVVLGALLGACQKRRNSDVSERVIQLLLELEPENSGNYVISSKLYANQRRWDDSAKMRVLMKQRGVAKTPGCSWIEINGQLHEFHAGDVLHEDSIAMYQFIIEEMQREGYIPKINCQ